MDAKPQRPVRTLRVQRDENAPMVNPPGKALHHRNKSTPALSNAESAAGLTKALGKRTAFGDVSNTALARASKDDASANSKVALKPQDKRAVNLTRPAQRPNGAAKPSLATSASLNNLNPASGGNAIERAQANTRKPQARRNSVFRDASLQAVPESSHAGQWQDYASTQQGQHGSFNQNAAIASTLPEKITSEDGSAARVRENHLERDPILSQNTDDASVREEYEELVDNVKNAGAEDSIVSGSTQDPTPGISNAALEAIPESADMHSPPDTVYDYAQNVSDPPEEYWDEEDEAYDEDGYVTARSQPSRGDNTTGGATVILYPKYTQDVKREIALAKTVVEASQTIEEYQDELGDTSMVSEYGTEIFQYMRDLERRLLPNPHYMDNQAEIQWSMRSVLMDWLVQVHLRFSLLPETLYLCVNYIDRFLSCKIVSLGKLQLVGATAIFIAAKYEEINCPSVHEIEYMVDNGYDADEILKAERFMLSMLQFELGWPGPMSFLRRISKADDYDLETRTLAKYFLEITIMDERFVGSPPSFLAAGAHCLARLMLRKGSWSQAHVYYSDYAYSQLHSVVSLILECCDVPQKHHAAVYEKYSDKRFKRASFFVEGEIARGFRVPDVPRDGRSTPRASPLENRLPMKRY